MLRCFVAIVVLGLVFVAGVCAGSGGYHSHREFGRHGYSHYQMMQHGGWDAGGMMQGTNYRYMNQDSRRVIMMQRTVGTVPAAVVATTSLVK